MGPTQNRQPPLMYSFSSNCPICKSEQVFEAEDDFWAGRQGLKSSRCPYNNCMTRERAVASVLFSLYERKTVINDLHIHEAAPARRGISLWLERNCKNYLGTGFFSDAKSGDLISKLRNEDLENQTFENGFFDLVLHLDVLEHVFNPFKALNEIYRTLKNDGKCIFSTPTYWDVQSSKRVAGKRADGSTFTIGPPEYHGNPQNKDGALVTWKYGYDLPLLISRDTRFDVEVRRFQSKAACAIGVMNEVYILSK